MLPKNRVSALILTVFFIAGTIAGYLALTYPSLFEPAPMPPAALPIGAGLIYAVVAVLISRSALVMGLEETLGFGGSGLARWLACGVIAGFLFALTSTRLLPLFKEGSFVRYTVEWAAFLVTAYIAYRVAFGKNVFKMFAAAPPSTAQQPAAQAGTGKGSAWFFTLCGLLLLVAMIYLAVNNAGSDTPLFIMALGGACLGLGSIWMGGMLLGARLPRRISAFLTLFMLAVMLVGLVLLVVGIVMHG